MKKYMIGCIILAIIITIGILGNIFLDSFYKKSIITLDSAESSMNSENCTQALKTAERLKSNLSDDTFILRMYISHSELDKLMISASEMISYAETENKNDFLAACKNMRERLDIIVGGEKVNIENIF